MVDLAKQGKPEGIKLSSVIGRIIFLSNLILIGFVVYRGISCGYSIQVNGSPGFASLNECGVLSEWKSIRNVYYLVYAASFILLGGFLKILGVKPEVPTPGGKLTEIQILVRSVVIGLILTTFSYAIGAILLDLYYLVIILQTHRR